MADRNPFIGAGQLRRQRVHENVFIPLEQRKTRAGQEARAAQFALRQHLGRPSANPFLTPSQIERAGGGLRRSRRGKREFILSPEEIQAREEEEKILAMEKESQARAKAEEKERAAQERAEARRREKIAKDISKETVDILKSHPIKDPLKMMELFDASATEQEKKTFFSLSKSFNNEGLRRRLARRLAEKNIRTKQEELSIARQNVAKEQTVMENMDAITGGGFAEMGGQRLSIGELGAGTPIPGTGTAEVAGETGAVGQPFPEVQVSPVERELLNQGYDTSKMSPQVQQALLESLAKAPIEPQRREPTQREQEAIQWLEKNSDHPNASAIRKKLRTRGVL